VRLFERLAAHLTSAIRLRQSVGDSKRAPAGVFSVRGTLLNSEGDAEIAGASDHLRRAVLAFDRHRTRDGRKDVELTTLRWTPLVQSRWSLLDDFDSDGRRFVVAVDNRPPTRAPRADFSEREHQVMTQAHLGHSNKLIAYELGLSASTVRVLLHRAAKKLGAATRAEAIARFDALVRARG
jgi:DNA-binding CsgD family transcriptional regulator